MKKLISNIIKQAKGEERQGMLKYNNSKLAFRDADIRVATEILKSLNVE